MTAEEYLLNIPARTKKKNTLDDVRVFLERLGDPERDLKIIHVAGTNGKGSVCADLAAILHAAGYRTGMFTSPHLTEFRERFRVNGEMISAADLERVFARVMDVVQDLQRQGYGHPTFFEFCFLIALVWFAGQGTDFCILETGMGGRLDATNAVRSPLISIITSVSLDHMQYLGDTVEQIAAEKAGIIRPGVPLIYDDNDSRASAVIAARAEELGVPVYPVSARDCAGLKKTFPDVNFSAPYQWMNAALAWKALQVLKLPGVDRAACRVGLTSVHWPGRMEEILPGVWLDGAHNPGGIRAFIDAVKRQPETRHGDGEAVRLLFAAVADKDYGEMIRLLCQELPIVQVTIAQLDTGRTADSQTLARLFREAGCRSVEQFADVRTALAAALSGRKGGERLYVVGSLYLIGEVRELLRKQCVSGKTGGGDRA